MEDKPAQSIPSTDESNPASTSPLIPPQTAPTKKSRLPFIIIGTTILVILFACIAAGFYVYRQQNQKMAVTTPKTTPTTPTLQEVKTDYFSFTLPTKNIIYQQNGQIGFITIKGSTGTSSYETVILRTYTPDQLIGNEKFLLDWDQLLQAPLGTTIKTCDDPNPSLCEMTKSENIKAKNGEFIQLRNEHPWEAGVNERSESYLAKYGDRYYSLSWKYDKNTQSNGALTRADILKLLSTFQFIGQNQTLEKTTWKTYANAQFAFSLQTPSEYIFTESNSKGSVQNNTSFFGPNVNGQVFSWKDPKGFGKFAVTIINDQPNITNEEIPDKLLFTIGAGASKTEDTTLSGKPATLIKIASGEGNAEAFGQANSTIYVVRMNGKMYLIEVNSHIAGATSDMESLTKQGNEVKTILNEMLSTFKFTN